MTEINQFFKEYRFLSNFYPAVVKDDTGNSYPTVEHAFVASKTLDRNLRFEVQQLDSPGKAKRYGKTLDLRDDWDQVKVGIMYQLLVQKFSEMQLREKLESTQPNDLVEGNTWHDQFWGNCACSSCPEKGQNHLGRMLMSIRDGLPLTY